MKKTITTVFAVSMAYLCFSQTVPTNGLQARYSFDDSKYKDISGNNNDLKESAPADSISLHTYTLEAGKISNCLNAIGTHESGLSQADGTNNNLKFTTALSISVWVYADFDKMNGNGFIVSNRCEAKLSNVFIYNNYTLWLGKSSKNIQFTIKDVILQTTEISDKTWHHIVITYNAGTTKIYLDGVLNTSSTSFPTSINSYNLQSLNGLKDRVQIGSLYGNGASQSNALIDEVYLYNRDLSESEVTQIYNYVGNSAAVNLTTKTVLNYFPNPAQNSIQIKSDKTMKSAAIINSIGQVVSVAINNNSIDLSKLASGVYVIQATDEFGNVYSNKLIKE